MKKFYIALMIGGTTLISSCSALDAMGDASIKKKQLLNGDTVSIGINIPPTAAWNCKEIGERQSFPWKAERGNALDVTTLSITESSQAQLATSAIQYANSAHLKTNYINLETPEGKTLSTGPIQWNLRRHAKAFAVYYQCEKINPEHKISHLKGTSGWGFGAGSSNPSVFIH